MGVKNVTNGQVVSRSRISFAHFLFMAVASTPSGLMAASAASKFSWQKRIGSSWQHWLLPFSFPRHLPPVCLSTCLTELAHGRKKAMNIQMPHGIKQANGKLAPPLLVPLQPSTCLSPNWLMAENRIQDTAHGKQTPPLLPTFDSPGTLHLSAELHNVTDIADISV